MHVMHQPNAQVNPAEEVIGACVKRKMAPLMIEDKTVWVPGDPFECPEPEDGQKVAYGDYRYGITFKAGANEGQLQMFMGMTVPLLLLCEGGPGAGGEAARALLSGSGVIALGFLGGFGEWSKLSGQIDKYGDVDDETDDSEKPSGCRWKEVEKTKLEVKSDGSTGSPTSGVAITNEGLEKALKTQPKHEFTLDELNAFGIRDLCAADYVRVAHEDSDKYYRPETLKVERAKKLMRGWSVDSQNLLKQLQTGQMEGELESGNVLYKQPDEVANIVAKLVESYFETFPPGSQ